MNGQGFPLLGRTQTDQSRTRRPTIRDAPKARAAEAIRPARTIEMAAVDISAGTLVIVSCPKGSQWEIGLSDVANPGSRLVPDCA